MDYYRNKVMECNAMAAYCLDKADSTQVSHIRNDYLVMAGRYSKAASFAARKITAILRGVR